MIRGFQKHTVETYRSNLKDFLSFVEDPVTVTQGTLRDHLLHIQQRNYSASTYNSYYAAINSFYEFLKYEGVITDNPIPSFRQRYIMHLMKVSGSETRQNISIKDMRCLIKKSNEIQIKIIPLMLAKTGLRRGEFLDLTESSINLDNDTITVPQKAKRHRQTLFIDPELHQSLEVYLNWRDGINLKCDYLWVSEHGSRVHKDYPGEVIKNIGHSIGLHEYGGPLERRITPHCFRHFLTTELFKDGMDPQYIKWLRGDSLHSEAWQIYNHIDPETVRAEYMRCVPSLL